MSYTLIDSTRLTPFELVPFTSHGHSYNNNANTADVNSQFNYRLAARLQTLPLNQQGVGGNRLDQCLGVIQSTWTTGSRGLVTLICLINDVSLFDSSTTTTVEAFRSCLVYLTAQSIASITSIAVVFGPGWTSGVSSTANSYVDLAWIGDAAYILIGFTASAGGTVVIKNSAGTTLATVVTGGYGADFTGSVLMSGFGAGNHTVRLTLSSGTATIVGIATLSPTPPVIAWLQEGAITGFTTSQNTLMMTTYPTAMRSMLGGFPSVIQIPFDAGWDSSTMLGSDSKHPNDKGHAYWARRVQAVLAAAIPNFQQGLNRMLAASSNIATYTPPAASYIGAGATIPAQVIGLTATAANQVSLVWSKPNDGGATMTGYVIKFRNPAGSGGYTNLITVPPTQVSYVIGNGLNQSSTDFIVAAQNSIGTGADSASSTCIPGAPIVVIASDAFNEGTSASPVTPTATTVGNKTWNTVVNSGAAVFTANGSSLSVITSSTVPHFIEDSGSANGSISIIIVGGIYCALVFRWTDINNFLVAGLSNNAFFFQKCVAGTFTSIALTSPPVFTTGTQVKAVCNGTTITLVIGGVIVYSGVPGVQATATKHGVGAGANKSLSVSNFLHTDSLLTP